MCRQGSREKLARERVIRVDDLVKRVQYHQDALCAQLAMGTVWSRGGRWTQQ